MNELSIHYFIVLALIVFVCGAVGVLVRRNILFVLMSLELMLNGVNILFVSASSHVGNLDGQIMSFFIITVAACEASVALAMVIGLYRKYGTVKTEFLKFLRG